jgi:hypothetical protein
MKYRAQKTNFAVASGASLPTTHFLPWQPSSWPMPDADASQFAVNLKRIFHETVLDEIRNVITDAHKSNHSLEHRGHVVALALFCAVDTLSSYAYKDAGKDVCPDCKRSDKVGPKYKKYIENLFPESYRPYSKQIYEFYRNNMVHSWNLFQGTIWPDNEEIEVIGGTLHFGLLNFFSALEKSVETFVEQLKSDEELQKSCRAR